MCLIVRRTGFAVLIAGLSLCIASACVRAPVVDTAKATAPPVVQRAVDGVLAAFDHHPLVALGDQHDLAQEGAF